MPLKMLSFDQHADEARYRPYINTGGPLDIINGKYVSGTQGNWVLSGGMGLTTAFIGGPNTFKSTCYNSCLINGLARFPHSSAFTGDSEFSTTDKDRLVSMSNLYLDEPEKREKHLESLKERLHVYDQANDVAESLDNFFDFAKEIRDEKIKNYKDYEVETEILDPYTLKPLRMLLPTFMGADSWTEFKVAQLNFKNEEIDADTEMGKQRTIFMEEGWKKAQLMRQLPNICAKAGIVFCLTGQVGKKYSLDGKPNKKDMTYMGQDETTKAMGPKFDFLMSSIFKINKADPLVDKNDRFQSEYPSQDHIPGNELQELKMILTRCKNAPSGTQLDMVSSQRYGIMSGLSYYNYLRTNKYYGLGVPNKVRNPILGDLNLGRTKIYDLSKEYKISRALELTYQLFMIQSGWTLQNQPVDYSISIEAFAEKLLSMQGYVVEDILNSRGWWTYTDAKVDRSLLTLPDILMMLNGSYKPKLHPVSK